MSQIESKSARRALVSVLTLSIALLGPFGCSLEDEAPAPAGSTAGNAGTPGLATAGTGGTLSNAGTEAGGSLANPGSAGTLGTAGAGGTAEGGSGGSANAGSAAGGRAGSGGGGAAGSGGTASGGSAGSGSVDGSKPIKVWLAGDSTVQNCSGACPCGWGSQFDALFNDNVTVVNSAVGGRSIQTWLYEAAVGSSLGQDGECTLSSANYDKRWTAMLDPNTGMKAGDYLFIQFGINDGDSGCPRHVGQARFKTLLATMATAAKERGAQAVFVTPVSAISCSGSTAQPTRGGFVTSTKDAATSSAVPLVDLHQLSINLYTSLGLCPNNDDYSAGKVGDFFCADHTHFEAAGAKQIAGSVAGALKGAGISLAAYLK